MDNQNETKPIGHQFQILTLILSEHQCNKCVHLAREKGICGGLVTIGRGTVNSSVLNLLGIKSQKREIVSFLLEQDKARELLDCLTEQLQLHKHGHGIAYLTSVLVVKQGACREQVANDTKQGVEEEGMYKKLTVIVDRGMAEDVMDIARKAGVGGGTIMHGRGVGAEHTTKLFGIEIEPEKELVLILTQSSLIDKVMDALSQELRIEEPERGLCSLNLLWKSGAFEPDQNDRDA